jgi:hypothetical protein
VHEKLMQLLERVSVALHLPDGSVVDPLQQQYKAALPDTAAMASSGFEQVKARPFAPKAIELLQSHAAQLDKILHFLDEQNAGAAPPVTKAIAGAARAETPGRTRMQL